MPKRRYQEISTNEQSIPQVTMMEHIRWLDRPAGLLLGEYCEGSGCKLVYVNVLLHIAASEVPGGSAPEAPFYALFRKGPPPLPVGDPASGTKTHRVELRRVEKPSFWHLPGVLCRPTSRESVIDMLNQHITETMGLRIISCTHVISVSTTIIDDKGSEKKVLVITFAGLTEWKDLYNPMAEFGHIRQYQANPIAGYTTARFGNLGWFAKEEILDIGFRLRGDWRLRTKIIGFLSIREENTALALNRLYQTRDSIARMFCQGIYVDQPYT
ncbi:hypothetical protein F4808DRAFT_467678 [Astrocystis sublimbata]|nr:hypothetical protein F4808DRAFT_467678 [Astrocystis sublimbata]